MNKVVWINSVRYFLESYGSSVKEDTCFNIKKTKTSEFVRDSHRVQQHKYFNCVSRLYIPFQQQNNVNWK